eukprot:sb/3468694/
MARLHCVQNVMYYISSCRFICYATHYIKVPAFITSILLICALNINKLSCLVFPLRARTRTRKTGIIISGLVWIAAAIFPVAQLVVDSGAVAFDYRNYRCQYVFRAEIWIWLRPLMIGVLMVFPNVLVLFTTFALVYFVVRSGKNIKKQGLLTVFVVAMVYIGSCAPDPALRTTFSTYSGTNKTPYSLPPLPIYQYPDCTHLRPFFRGRSRRLCVEIAPGVYLNRLEQCTCNAEVVGSSRPSPDIFLIFLPI